MLDDVFYLLIEGGEPAFLGGGGFSEGCFGFCLVRQCAPGEDSVDCFGVSDGGEFEPRIVSVQGFELVESGVDRAGDCGGCFLFVSGGVCRGL